MDADVNFAYDDTSDKDNTSGWIAPIKVDFGDKFHETTLNKLLFSDNNELEKNDLVSIFQQIYWEKQSLSLSPSVGYSLN